MCERVICELVCVHVRVRAWCSDRFWCDLHSVAASRAGGEKQVEIHTTTGEGGEASSAGTEHFSQEKRQRSVCDRVIRPSLSIYLSLSLSLFLAAAPFCRMSTLVYVRGYYMRVCAVLCVCC